MIEDLLKDYPVESRDPNFGSVKFKILNLQMIKRYEFASRFCSGIVIDAACGSGYGCPTLLQRSKHLTGIDISKQNIELAMQRYYRHGLDYKIVDMEGELPFEDSLFDTVVSLETIEHIKNVENLMHSFNRILKRKGRLILATPNGKNTSPLGRSHYNPFHKKEFSKQELINLVKENEFKIEGVYGQGILIGYILKSIYKKGIKPKHLNDKTYLSTIANNLPFFSRIFSKISPCFVESSKEIILVAQKS